jgi:secondary thiamine-phosphate synthase enzyme
MVRQAAEILRFPPCGQGLHEITREVLSWIVEQGVATGLLTLHCRHTSASLLIQENADPDVQRDLEAFFAHLAPEGGPYRHQDEGPDDMPAHLRAALTQTSLSIPVIESRLALGTWQGVYLFEHRRAPHRREVAVHLIGE